MTETIRRRQLLGAALAGGLVLGVGDSPGAAARGVSGGGEDGASAGNRLTPRQPLPGEADEQTRAVLLRHAGELGGCRNVRI